MDLWKHRQNVGRGINWDSFLQASFLRIIPNRCGLCFHFHATPKEPEASETSRLAATAQSIARCGRQNLNWEVGCLNSPVCSNPQAKHSGETQGLAPRWSPQVSYQSISLLDWSGKQSCHQWTSNPRRMNWLRKIMCKSSEGQKCSHKQWDIWGISSRRMSKGSERGAEARIWLSYLTPCSQYPFSVLCTHPFI